MNSSLFFWIFVVFFFAHELWETLLTLLNNRHILKHKDAIPDFYRDKIDFKSYTRSMSYNLERARFGLLMNGIGVGLIVWVILAGSFDKLDLWLRQFTSLKGIAFSVLYCGVVGLVLMVLKIPSSLYSQFVIEQKYGFNKMTAKIFVLDLLKGLGLGAAFGVPLLFLLFGLYQTAGSYWWLWAFGAFFSFELIMAAIYPMLLAPLFNKFTPLPEGELKDKIFELAKKIGFKMSGIFTIDGSKRSAHSNAYFAGLGKMRRIVLFDTLLGQLNHAEIISVLAHEMGHNKKKHIQRQLWLSFVFTLVGFWVLSLVIGREPFYAAFRAGPPAPHKALILFSLFSGAFTFWLTPLMNYLSRKYEYEADRFSVEATGDKESMASSLIKLSKENLSNLTPHRLYSFYHYSHPTTSERVKALGAPYVSTIPIGQ